MLMPNSSKFPISFLEWLWLMLGVISLLVVQHARKKLIIPMKIEIKMIHNGWSQIFAVCLYVISTYPPIFVPPRSHLSPETIASKILSDLLNVSEPFAPYCDLQVIFIMINGMYLSPAQRFWLLSILSFFPYDYMLRDLWILLPVQNSIDCTKFEA